MHWIYILKCKTPFYYVGETTRLYRRFWEHSDGKGGLNTAEYEPEHIVAIYDVQNIQWFINYVNNVCNTPANYYRYSRKSLENFGIAEELRDPGITHRYAETYIAECLMKRTDNVRGGKYTRFDAKYKTPNLTGISLPLCYCQLPCDIQVKSDDTIYFRCPKKNIWEDMRINVNVADDPACKFYQSYDDCKIKKLANELKATVKQSPWIWTIPSGPYELCLGGCGKEYDSDNCVRSSRNLCYSCFISAEIRMKLKCKYATFTQPDMSSCLI
jgi:hypothetical protein